MNLSQSQRIGVFALLALLLAATRISHFALIPDASWAVFFIAGFYLRGSLRWVLPVLFVLAVLVDFAVITSQGLNFWSHYCVSPAYWLLLPSYMALGAGGAWASTQYRGIGARTLGAVTAALLVSFSVCFVLSNGSYYWLSDSVAAPSMAGWGKNLGDWYLPFLRGTAMYVALAAVVHVVVAKLSGHAAVTPGQALHRG